METGKYAGRSPELRTAHFEHLPPYTFALVYRDVGVDRGLALHVFGPVNGREEEILRFDCFRGTPHYHLGWSYRDEPFLEIPRASNPFEWAVESLGTSFEDFVRRAGADVVVSPTSRSELAAVLDRLRDRAAQLERSS